MLGRINSLLSIHSFVQLRMWERERERSSGRPPPSSLPWLPAVSLSRQMPSSPLPGAWFSQPSPFQSAVTAAVISQSSASSVRQPSVSGKPVSARPSMCQLHQVAASRRRRSYLVEVWISSRDPVFSPWGGGGGEVQWPSHKRLSRDIRLDGKKSSSRVRTRRDSREPASQMQWGGGGGSMGLTHSEGGGGGEQWTERCCVTWWTIAISWLSEWNRDSIEQWTLVEGTCRGRIPLNISDHDNPSGIGSFF